MQRLISAEQSDIFDVLAYVAYALPTLTRAQRAANSKRIIFDHYKENEQDFLTFVLQHYVDQGVSELEQEKLPGLLELKYHSIPDAVPQLGEMGAIRKVFLGFQEYLYKKTAFG